MDKKIDKEYVIGVDTGGTFTDITVIDQEGKIIHEKSPSTPPDFSIGIMNSIAQAAKTMALDMETLISRTSVFNHGMTVATNMIINRAGSKTGLITTKGFEDTILIMKARGKCLGLSEMEIKHQARCQKPEPFVPKHLIRGVTERIDCFGNIVVPLNHNELDEIVRDLVEHQKVEAIAICTLWSLTNQVHEKEIEDLIHQKYPEVFVSRSSELVPLLGEYERTVTTVFNAYLMPETRKYLTSLDNSLKRKKLSFSPMIMQAAGGITPIEEAMIAPVFTISSGPAGGMIGSSILGEILGYKNIITTDVGGTSFDVGLIIDGEPLRKDDAVLDQYALRLPMIDVSSIGAAGGSVVWYDEISHTMKIGPQSMGAFPGPACYGRGGSVPTLADVDLILGFLDPDSFFGGRMRLDKEKASAAMDTVASKLGMDIYEAARGARRLACVIMANLIENKVLFRGYDPRECVMFLFGGGGPEFGSEYGRQSGAKELIMLRESSTLSAFGIAVSDILYQELVSEIYFMPGNPKSITQSYEKLEEKILNLFEKQGFNEKDVLLTREGQLRYGRQVNYVSVPVPSGELSEYDVKKIMDDFEIHYETLFGKGSGYKKAGIEMVNLKVYGVVKTTRPSLRKLKKRGQNPSLAQKGSREVYLEDTFSTVPVFDWEKLEPGNILAGPAIVESTFTTGVILNHMEGQIDEYRNIHVVY